MNAQQWLDQVALVLLELEHRQMTVDTDRRYQQVCAELAPRVSTEHMRVALERAALACHHCRGR